MHWAPLILGSAVLLGFYDVCKKHAVDRNAVMPVLLLATASGTAALLVALACAGRLGTALACPAATWWLLLLKSALVMASWILAWYAMRMLPISIAAPIRASQPLWTVAGALLLFHEAPRGAQWAGMAVVFAGYAAFSVLGRLEGVGLRQSLGIPLMLGATALGAASALYDKWLLQPCRIPPETVQAWFSIDLVALIGLALLVQRAAGAAKTRLEWRWTIPAVGLLLVGADWLYFSALAQPDTQIGVLSLVRRSNVVISFSVGGALFRDANRGRKLLALIVVLAGVVLLCW